MTDKDREYYRSRAVKERIMAQAASDSAVKAIHLKLAAVYEESSAANDRSEMPENS